MENQAPFHRSRGQENPRRAMGSKIPQSQTGRTVLGSLTTAHSNTSGAAGSQATRVQPSRAVKKPTNADLLQPSKNVLPNTRPVPLQAHALYGGLGAAINPQAPSFNVFVDDQENFPPLQGCSKAKQSVPVEELPKPKIPCDAVSPMVLEVSDEDGEQEAKIGKDVQENNEDEIYQMALYKHDVHLFLRARELQRMPNFASVTLKQREITPNMRTILMDWLVEVSEEYRLHRETLHLAVAYVDRFLCKASVQKCKLQLVGAASMFIAAKYEEIYPPDVSEFVYITDDTYSKKQVLRMEATILQFLHFDVSIVTGNCFIELYSSWLNMNEELKAHVAYLSELCLVFGDNFVSLPVSQVTCSCILYARLSRGLEPWPVSHSFMMGYRREELLSCVRHVHEMMSSLETATQRAVIDKYRTEKYHKVAQQPIPFADILF